MSIPKHENPAVMAAAEAMSRQARATRKCANKMVDGVWASAQPVFHRDALGRRGDIRAIRVTYHPVSAS